MADFVKEITDVWNHKGTQEAYDRGKLLLEKIAEEIKRLQGQRTAITALMQHLEASGARATAQLPLVPRVNASDRPRVILEAADAVLDSTSGTMVVRVQDVLAELDRRKLDLDVQQPMAVIGTVLSRSLYYQKIARNTFHRIEPLPTQ